METGGRAEIEIAHTWDGEPVPAAERARVRLSLRPDALAIAVLAPFHADPPPATPAGPTPGLWEHEVVELFVAAAGGEPLHYTEVELSPWGHHLVLRLAGIRHAVASGLPLDYRSRLVGDRWVGAARLPRRLLPLPPWRVNAFAIHGQGGRRRYLAAAPLPGRAPDFHQPQRFPLLQWQGRGGR